jgi:hypothetical protein
MRHLVVIAAFSLVACGSDDLHFSFTSSLGSPSWTIHGQHFQGTGFAPDGSAGACALTASSSHEVVITCRDASAGSIVATIALDIDPRRASQVAQPIHLAYDDGTSQCATDLSVAVATVSSTGTIKDGKASADFDRVYDIAITPVAAGDTRFPCTPDGDVTLTFELHVTRQDVQ